MSFNYENLDTITRQFMLEELALDISSNNVYLSPRLNDNGKVRYVEVLKKAFTDGDEIKLKNEINYGLLNAYEQRKKPNGGYTQAKVPITAAETLADGEFNRYYIRALCRRVIQENNKSIQVYRAKEVDRPRFESEMKIGLVIDPRATLKSLRETNNFDTILQIPSGPNSGLSVRIIETSKDVSA
ncbi:hypothetical protein [Gorillibacterium sp. CAU 1737]|uniref:hypothetical protein n=1 Tax=Gorillibacterium sp. CAU 1737 TaxID=3140362 RepID=UPI00326158C8